MKPMIGSAALAALLLASCRESDFGSGVNTVEREYARPASEVWTAALKGVEAADLKVKSDRHDQMGGELLACRANGSEVRIDVKSFDQRSCRVSVRVEPGDRDLAILLQERIAEHAGLGAARSGLFGGCSLQATYVSDLSSSLVSARQSFAALRITVITEESHATWITLDGRLRDSTPVRIKMEKVDEHKTQVTFIAGNEKNDDHNLLVHRMKDEYERSASSEGSDR